MKNSSTLKNLISINQYGFFILIFSILISSHQLKAEMNPSNSLDSNHYLSNSIIQKLDELNGCRSPINKCLQETIFSSQEQNELKAYFTNWVSHQPSEIQSSLSYTFSELNQNLFLSDINEKTAFLTSSTACGEPCIAGAAFLGIAALVYYNMILPENEKEERERKLERVSINCVRIKTPDKVQSGSPFECFEVSSESTAPIKNVIIPGR